MADLGELDVLIIGGGMAGCIVATRLAEHGVHPETGEPLRIAILERGPHFKGGARPGYGIPLRRQLFTCVTPENRASTRYTMASGLSPEERDRKRDAATSIPGVAMPRLSEGDHCTGNAIPRRPLIWTTALTPQRSASTGPPTSCAPPARRSRGSLTFTPVRNPCSPPATSCSGMLPRLLDTR